MPESIVSSPKFAALVCIEQASAHMPKKIRQVFCQRARLTCKAGIVVFSPQDAKGHPNHIKMKRRCEIFDTEI